MIRVRPQKDLLPDLRKLKDDFRRKFDRDMTAEEIQCYRDTKALLGDVDRVERRIIVMPTPNERRQPQKDRRRSG